MQPETDRDCGPSPTVSIVSDYNNNTNNEITTRATTVSVFSALYNQGIYFSFFFNLIKIYLALVLRFMDLWKYITLFGFINLFWSTNSKIIIIVLFKIRRLNKK